MLIIWNWLLSVDWKGSLPIVAAFLGLFLPKIWEGREARRKQREADAKKREGDADRCKELVRDFTDHVFETNQLRTHVHMLVELYKGDPAEFKAWLRHVDTEAMDSARWDKHTALLRKQPEDGDE